jgi:hypothetical protein
MSKELEAFNRVWEDCSKLDLDYVSKHNLMDDLREIKKALTPPTEKEVCKHLNESFGLNRHNTNLHFIYDKESREFRMVSKNKIYRYISTKRQDDDAIALIDLDIDDIAILGRFFESEMKE